MQSTTINGIRLHNVISGSEDAPILVFINSLGTDFRVWDKVVARLGNSVRVLRYDKRGHGLSDAPSAPYVMDEHIGDLEALLEHHGLSDVTVCGLSVGGMIAQGVAVKRPDLVSRVILSDTGHCIGTAEMWDGRIGAVREGGIEALADATMERWFSANFHAEHGDEMRLWRNMLTRTPIEGYVGTSYALRDTDLTDATKTIIQPTLCFGGAEDGSTPPELMREMTALIEGAVFHEIPGAGHLPCVEVPDTVAALISDFMAQSK